MSTMFFFHDAERPWMMRKTNCRRSRFEVRELPAWLPWGLGGGQRANEAEAEYRIAADGCQSIPMLSQVERRTSQHWLFCGFRSQPGARGPWPTAMPVFVKVCFVNNLFIHLAMYVCDDDDRLQTTIDIFRRKKKNNKSAFALKTSLWPQKCLFRSAAAAAVELGTAC